MGAGTDIVKHFMEIRGLGLIDVRSMFGIRAIRYQKRIEVVVELEDWRKEPGIHEDRPGRAQHPILEVDMPHVRLPIFPGKNVTVITEVISLNYLLKHYGYDPAKEFAARLEGAIGRRRRAPGDRLLRARFRIASFL